MYDYTSFEKEDIILTLYYMYNMYIVYTIYSYIRLTII